VVLLNTAAAVYLADRKYEEAEALLRDAVAAGSCLPAGDPVMIQVLRNYADALERLNRGDEAARMRAESDVISVKALPKSSH
jgi:hypothetical protein